MSLVLRTMDPADLEFADSVRAAVGWNQTVADWERLYSVAPDGCFIAEWEGRRAGTGIATCYGTDLAWIGMILVHPDFRRHGIGRAIMSHCLEFLKNRGIACIKLDATPLGKTLYDQLGFRDEWTLARWEAARVTATCSAKGVRPMRDADWPAMEKLDREAFGVSREDLLGKLSLQSRCVIHEDAGGGVAGFGMMRPGSRADYLGPVVAANPESGTAIVHALLGAAAGKPVYWDIPDDAIEAVALAKSLGFVSQRPLIRMHLGENRNPGRPRHQFAIADPATG